MGRTQTEGHCVTSEPEVTALFGHTVPYSSPGWLKHLVEQVVEIAFLDAYNKFSPFIRSISKDGAARFSRAPDQDGLTAGRHLDTGSAVAVEGGAPGDTLVTPSIFHDIIS